MGIVSVDLKERVMRTRNFLIGMLTAGLAHSAAVASDLDEIQLRINPDLTDIGVVKVDGEADGTYNKILTKTLEYGVYVRGDPPPDAVPGTSILSLGLYGGDWISSKITADWTRYTLSIPYHDFPYIPTMSYLPYKSPVGMCNDRLRQSSGAARNAFLKKGDTMIFEGAYELRSVLGWKLDNWHGGDTWRRHMNVPVKIKCLALNRDRSQDGGPSRTSGTMPPLFWSTTPKIEPAKMVRDGRYMCPSQLKLYGFVETGRKFQGKAIFMGPHYLSAITPLNFSYAGTRNLTATYPVKWKEIGGLTTTSDPKPKKQKLTFRFNIADLNGKLLRSVEKTLNVACNKIEVNMPAGLSGNPAN
jgi:hypothetical protein